MKMGLLGYLLPDVCARQSGSAEGLDGEIRCGTAKGQGGMLDVEHLFRVNCCPVPGVAPTCAYSHLLVSLQMCVCVYVCARVCVYICVQLCFFLICVMSRLNKLWHMYTHTHTHKDTHTHTQTHTHTHTHTHTQGHTHTHKDTHTKTHTHKDTHTHTHTHTRTYTQGHTHTRT